MKRGRKPKVEPSQLISVLNKYKDKFICNGLVVGPRTSVYRDISTELGEKITPSAVYTFIKQNNRAKALYKDWGLVSGEEEVTSGQISDVFRDLTSSEDDEVLKRQFTITLSKDEWLEIAPKEYLCSRKGRTDSRAYQILTPNVWTHVINEHFWIQTKLSCCLVFKRANVSSDNPVYVDIRGTCKDCNGSFQGKIISVPREDARVLVDCNYESESVCRSGKKKRLMRGAAKDKLVQYMIRDKKSASAVRTKEASRIMEHGDVEPSHVPSLNSLRVAKSKAISSELAHDDALIALHIAKFTTPYQESIHNIGLNKFFVHYWSPNQMNVYRQYHRQCENPTLAIDATGGIVKKLKQPFGNKSGHLFLYQSVAVGEADHLQFPVCQMISESHNNMAVENWLQQWLRSGGVIPKTVVCDRSVALLSGIVKAFTQYKSLGDYVRACYYALNHVSEPSLPNCFIRCDVAHVIKNICSWKPMKSMSKSVRSFNIRCIVEIIKSQYLATLKTLLQAIFLVITSPTVGKLVIDRHPTILDTKAEVARKYLKNVISDDSFEQLSDLLELATPEDDLTDLFEVEVNELTTKEETNPFVGWAKNIYQELEENQTQEEGEYDNALLCPQLVPLIIDLLSDLPIISNIMRPLFQYGTDFASSARVESTFNQIKNRLFSDKPLPLRVDSFVRSHIDALDGELKLVAASSSPPETQSITNISHSKSNASTGMDEKIPPPQEDLILENWRGQADTTRNKTDSRNKSIDSYLVRKPEIGNVDLPGKKTVSIGILKNGNRSEELKPIYLKSQDKEIRVTACNTCAFDSVTQIFACTYCDSEYFKILCNRAIQDGNKYFKLLKDVACSGISSSIYRQRMEILKEAFPPTQNYHQKLIVLQCEVTVAQLLSRIIPTYPSATDTASCTCSSCPNVETKHLNVLSVLINQQFISIQLEQELNILFGQVQAPCSNRLCYKEEVLQCNGIKTITTTPNDVLLVELINPKETDDTDVTREVKIALADIPQTIMVDDKRFKLRGAIGFSATRKSLSEVGHYVANAHRITGQWELYDDCASKCRSISSNKLVEVQVVMYTL